MTENHARSIVVLSTGEFVLFKYVSSYTGFIFLQPVLPRENFSLFLIIRYSRGLRKRIHRGRFLRLVNFYKWFWFSFKNPPRCKSQMWKFWKAFNPVHVCLTHNIRVVRKIITVIKNIRLKAICLNSIGFSEQNCKQSM